MVRTLIASPQKPRALTVDESWEVAPAASEGLWGLLRERFLSFGLVLVLALMLLVSLTVSTALAAPGG